MGSRSQKRADGPCLRSPVRPPCVGSVHPAVLRPTLGRLFVLPSVLSPSLHLLQKPRSMEPGAFRGHSRGPCLSRAGGEGGVAASPSPEPGSHHGLALSTRELAVSGALRGCSHHQGDSMHASPSQVQPPPFWRVCETRCKSRGAVCPALRSQILFNSSFYLLVNNFLSLLVILEFCAQGCCAHWKGQGAGWRGVPAKVHRPCRARVFGSMHSRARPREGARASCKLGWPAGVPLLPHSAGRDWMLPGLWPLA